MKIEIEVEELQKYLELIIVMEGKIAAVSNFTEFAMFNNFIGFLKSKLDNAYPKPGEVWEDRSENTCYVTFIPEKSERCMITHELKRGQTIYSVEWDVLNRTFYITFRIIMEFYNDGKFTASNIESSTDFDLDDFCIPTHVDANLLSRYMVLFLNKQDALDWIGENL